MIYVTLVGEGLNVLRAVRAEHLGRDFYKNRGRNAGRRNLAVGTWPSRSL